MSAPPKTMAEQAVDLGARLAWLRAALTMIADVSSEPMVIAMVGRALREDRRQAEGAVPVEEIRREAARQASAAAAARALADPESDARANTHEFCAGVLEALVD